MIPIRTATDFPASPIEFHRWPRLISITISLRFPLSPDLSIQFEIHCQVEDHVDRLTVERARLESPTFHCIDRCAIQTERQPFQHFYVLYDALLVDDGLDDDDP